MSVTPAYLDELRSRLSIAEVIGRRLQWDQRKSNPAKGDYWACCPFHGEKTPSFHVEDRKGFFYCFGCQEKGDAIGFVMKMDGAPFGEVVERLAAEAGMAPPERDPKARERAEKRGGLTELMEAAQRFYRGQLSGAAAREARFYLEGRELRPETQETFGLGFAPRGPTALTDHLLGQGAERKDILEAGLSGARDDGSLYDRFRERITFPIRDPAGRMIAFGGRAMRADAQAKYLNSPETPLFSKGRTLYNLGPARAAAGKGAALIVAEGYMDVIALAQAGFEAAVAPLGTALTEDQLRLLWRVADEPVLALDGDAAGQRAAARTAGLALPLLAPGKTLRFLTLPEGRDPDDLIRESGRGAFAALMERAEPLAETLWRLETDGKTLDTPERRAGFDAAVRTLLERIEDPGVRGHYAEMFREKRGLLFAPAPRPKKDWKPQGARGRDAPFIPQSASSEARRSALAANHPRDPRTALEEMILKEALSVPESPEKWGESLSEADFTDHMLDSIRSGLISALFTLIDDGAPVTPSALYQETRRRTETGAQARLQALEPIGTRSESSSMLEAALRRRRKLSELETERLDAESDFKRDGDERAYKRMLRAREAHEAAVKSGFQADSEDSNVSVRSYVEQEIWKKKPKPRSGR